MFRMGCYSYAKCFAQRASLRFRLNEHYASLQGAVFCFLLRFPAGLMPMASAPSRGVAGTMAGSCHSPLFLLPIPKCVECFGDFLLLACASFLNEYNFTVMYMLGKANKEQFGLGTGSQKLPSFCSSPLYQHEPGTEEHVFLSQVALLCSWGCGASSWGVRAHSQSGLTDGGYPVQHRFALPSLFPEKRAWASKDSSAPLLAETGTVTWLWLKVRDEGKGEHGLKSQCIAALVAHSHPHKAIKKVKFTNYRAGSVLLLLLCC